MWSYEDASGNRNVLSGTTDASTGISTLSVSTDVPGYYSCDVSKEGGMKMIYTVEILDLSLYTGNIITRILFVRGICISWPFYWDISKIIGYCSMLIFVEALVMFSILSNKCNSFQLGIDM